jgi:uncharacterized membrane protein
MIKTMRWLLGAMVGFLALVGVGAAATHYLYEPYNPGFLEYPTIVALHVVLGGLYLALAPFQFVKRIRSRHLGYHRWAGRVLVSVGLVVGATGLFMGMFIPIAGWVERVYIGIFGALFVVALVKGFAHIRAGRVALHREWMIRAFAIGLAVATQRVIFIPALLAVADPTQGAGGHAFGCVVFSGVRRARLGGGSMDPPHPQASRTRSERSESRLRSDTEQRMMPTVKERR